MNREQFEARVLDLWMTTRIPLTRAHVQYHTGVARRRMSAWLDEMVTDGVLEVEVDDDGEMVWQVPGAARPIQGPRTFAELERLGRAREAVGGARRAAGVGGRARDRSMTDEVSALGLGALALARRGPSALEGRGGADGKRKSLLLSAGLSFFGPLGWLYAGSLREAVPATAAAVILAAVIPTFLLMPVLWLVMPLSALVGLVYAWQYNHHGGRTSLFLDDKSGKKPRKG